jgi:hypothetical protein
MILFVSVTAASALGSVEIYTPIAHHKKMEQGLFKRWATVRTCWVSSVRSSSLSSSSDVLFRDAFRSSRFLFRISSFRHRLDSISWHMGGLSFTLSCFVNDCLLLLAHTQAHTFSTGSVRTKKNFPCFRFLATFRLPLSLPYLSLYTHAHTQTHAHTHAHTHYTHHDFSICFLNFIATLLDLVNSRQCLRGLRNFQLFSSDDLTRLRPLCVRDTRLGQT